jgi:regulator of sigma E protease
MLAFLWVAIKTIFAICFVLISIAMIHEFGHYITAKMCGVWVLEFAIGFGERIWKKRFGETLYSLRPLPLGGFVRLAGMDNVEEEKEEGKEGEDENKEKEKEKEEEDPDLPKVPADHPKSYLSRPWWAKVIVLAAGATMNLVWAMILLSLIYIFAGGPISNIAVLEAPRDKVAYKAGVRNGDIIYAINGEELKDWSRGMALINNNPGKEITLSIIRNHPINKDASAGGIMRDNIAYSNNSYQTHDEEKLDIKVIPEGSMGSAKIGIGLAPNNYDYTKLPLGTAIQRGCEDAINIIAQTIDGLYRMITGQTKADVAGPVKIMKMIKDQSSKGWTDLFYLTALLSVNIGLLNLLPLPVLDGGRIVFVLLDVLFSIFNKIFKTKLVVNQKVEESIHFVGMICLILLMIYVTFKDVISFF